MPLPHLTAVLTPGNSNRGRVPCLPLHRQPSHLGNVRPPFSLPLAFLNSPPPFTRAIYTQYRGVRDPANILYLIVSAGLVLFTVCAFGVYTAKVAASSADLDFGALGSPAAYAVTILSWLAALIGAPPPPSLNLALS